MAEDSDKLSKVDKTIAVDLTEEEDPLKGIRLGHEVRKTSDDGTESSAILPRRGDSASEAASSGLESEEEPEELEPGPEEPVFLNQQELLADTNFDDMSGNKGSDHNMSQEQIQSTLAESISKQLVNQSEDFDQQLQNQITKALQSELSKSINFSGLADLLVSTISRLTKENSILRQALDEARNGRKTSISSKESSPNGQQTSDSTDSPFFEEFHSVQCNRLQGRIFYRDAPRRFKGDLKTDHLRGRETIDDIEIYLEENTTTAFALIHSHFCLCRMGKTLGGTTYLNGRLAADTLPDIAADENTDIFVGKHATKAIPSVLQQHPERFPGFSTNTRRNVVFGRDPYLFYLHGKTLMELAESSGLDAVEVQCLQLLYKWFEDNRRDDWNEADGLILKGKINGKHYGKLFLPGDLMVHCTPDPFEGNLIRMYKMVTQSWTATMNKDRYEVECWEFNGQFLSYNDVFDLRSTAFKQQSDPEENEDLETDIASLEWHPLRFASSGLKEKMLERGERVWNYREKRIVCYIERKEPTSSRQLERRMMIDYTVYRRQYPGKDIFTSVSLNSLSEAAMKKSEPPEGDFLLLLPAQIHAFDFATKNWSLVRVDRLTNVTWDKNAFKQLVAPPRTRELIQAAVSAHGNQLKAAPDIIAGKGQGLLILLHGGPGTGKTLTAESIAEEQERPLYRVTCGDMGTTPAEIESYLAAVLELGKCWGCVVLLDEADVFLEERTHADQNRNAIISVFLRVLEYYDGILILTTNRVGSFDEAFKSRIHLALGYPNLDEEQRERIWMNFIKMLSKMNERVDTADLELNISRMARININGRQIRNVITIARHLARFRGQRLRYEHIHDAIESVTDFSDYLEEVKGMSDDRWARDDKVR